MKAGRIITEGLWKVSLPPLVVYYTVNPIERIVEISNVALTK